MYLYTQAAKCGADAALVVTPAYVKPSQQGLVKFYEAVADGGALPVVLYNVRARRRLAPPFTLDTRLDLKKIASHIPRPKSQYYR